jgi:orotate phosphoribosyltransferase
MYKTADEWVVQYKKKNALWIHDGNPKRPHALLTSGKHSDGFFNSRLVIPDEILLDEAVSDLLELLFYSVGDISVIEGVVGPQTGATRLAQLFSSKISKITGNCFWASPAKSGEGKGKTMIFNEGEKKLLPNKQVLLCEDVLSTGRSVALTSKAITEARGNNFSFIVVLVKRSGLTEIDGKKIIALINHPMSMWEPKDCLLCRKGSVAVRPKDNWVLLNAFY